MSDGTPWRPLVHIQDLSGAFLAVLKAPREIVHNQVFNVGKNSENYRVKDLAEIVQAAIPGCAIEYTGEHGADVRNYRVDFSKFQKALGKNALMGRDVEKGVDELCLAYKNTRLNLSNFQGDKFTRLKRIQALLNNGKLDKNLRWIEAAEK
jgi:nucleoside-diphosphate-sugar epimerase